MTRSPPTPDSGLVVPESPFVSPRGHTAGDTSVYSKIWKLRGGRLSVKFLFAIVAACSAGVGLDSESMSTGARTNDRSYEYNPLPGCHSEQLEG